MSDSNYCQCNIKSRIDRKMVLLRNSSVLGTILFIITMRPVLWQNSACVQQKTLVCECSSAKVQLWPTREQCLFLKRMLGGTTADMWLLGWGMTCTCMQGHLTVFKKGRCFVLFCFYNLCSLDQKVKPQGVFTLVISSVLGHSRSPRYLFFMDFCSCFP